MVPRRPLLAPEGPTEVVVKREERHTRTPKQLAHRCERIQRKPRLLFVGAFPPLGGSVYGGNITDCKLLMESSFPAHVDVIRLDSTQRTVPPPPLIRRIVDGAARLGRFVREFHHGRPDVVLLFASAGLSFVV
jgi:hypothetical protein